MLPLRFGASPVLLARLASVLDLASALWHPIPRPSFRALAPYSLAASLLCSGTLFLGPAVVLIAVVDHPTVGPLGLVSVLWHPIPEAASALILVAPFSYARTSSLNLFLWPPF